MPAPGGVEAGHQLPGAYSDMHSKFQMGVGPSPRILRHGAMPYDACGHLMLIWLWIWFTAGCQCQKKACLRAS